jgi:cell division septation protein DedD
MIRIERHIHNLLFEHDCISIPGLGGLVAQHFRSEINPGTNIMRPPSKRISFHEDLTANRNLLVTRISDEENISLAETNELIEKTVQNWQLSLAGGESIKLEGIGRFYQDKQGNICFNQSLEVNFNLNSFGLDMFRATAIQREVQITAAVSSALQQRVSHQKEQSGKKTLPYWRAAAVFAGVGILLTLGFYKTDIKLNDEFMAGFNPLHYSRGIEVPVVSEKTNPQVTTEEPKAAENTVQYQEALNQAIQTENAEPENGFDELTNTPQTVLPYQVIVGSFKEVSNARDLILRLQRLGYDPQIIEDNTSFSKVSIEGFDNRSAAAASLKNYKTRVNKGAWIYTVR